MAGNVDNGEATPQDTPSRKRLETRGQRHGVRGGVFSVLVLLIPLCLVLAWSSSAQADAGYEWHGFRVELFAGWDVHEAAYDGGGTGLESKVLYLRSLSGSRVLVVFVDGSKRRDALAESSLMLLVETYLSSYFLRSDLPVDGMEPWDCRLGVGDDVPVYGTHATLNPDVLGESGPTDAWACASRDFSAGQLLFVVGWATGEEAEELVSDGEFPELRGVLKGAGFSTGETEP